jgi:hypothetical protein
MSLKTTFFVLALLASNFAYSATYTVSTSGSDKNPGTVAAPFATIARAAPLLKPGDIVNVLPGNYAAIICGYDDVHPSIHGTAAAPIVINGGPGVNITTRNNKQPNGFDFIGCSYVVIKGFAFLGMPAKGASFYQCTNMTVQSCSAIKSGKWGFYASHCDNFTLLDSEGSHSVVQHGVYIANSCVNPTIQRCRFMDNRNCGIHMNGDGSQGGNGIITGAVITDNLIVNNGVSGGAGINLDGVQHSTISNNRLVDNHAAGIVAFRGDASDSAKYNVISNNFIYMAPGAKYCIGVKGGSIGTTLIGNVTIGKYGVVMTPDSLTGTKFTPANPVVYSIDDGNSSINQDNFAKSFPIVTSGSQK